MKSEFISSFLKLKNIAVVGVSRSTKGFGVAVYNHLKSNNITVFAVNRKGGFSGNIKLYESLFKIDQKIDGIVAIVPPSETENIVQQAKDLGINNIWMQQGSESNSAIEYCEQQNINFVINECILMFAEPVRSIHRFHRLINKITGKYPKF